MWQIPQQIPVQLTEFVLEQDLLISYFRTHTYVSINIVAFVFDLVKKWKQSILKKNDVVCFIWMSWWRFLTACFGRCHLGMSLLIVFELLSSCPFLPRFIPAFSASAWKGSQCHSEWPPPHLWKFRWEKQVLSYRYFPHSLLFHSLCKLRSWKLAVSLIY